MRELTDDEIIVVRKVTPSDYSRPWGDTLAFARAILAAAQAACPPRDPTQAMVAAAVSATGDAPDDGRIMARVIWRAMHDAWTREQAIGKTTTNFLVGPGGTRLTGPLNHCVRVCSIKDIACSTPAECERAPAGCRLDHQSATIDAARAEPPATSLPTMDDAIAAGDGTLHGAIDYWQGVAQRQAREIAEAKRSEAHARDVLRVAERDYKERLVLAEAERDECARLARVRSDMIGEQQREIDTLAAIVRAADMMRRHFVTYAGDQWANASMARDAYDAARAKVAP